jgi:hypothetical protein
MVEQAAGRLLKKNNLGAAVKQSQRQPYRTIPDRGRSDFAEVLVTWATAGRVATEINPTATPIALVPEMKRFGIPSPLRTLVKRMFSVLSVQQLFDELHALETQELCILFLAPVDSALAARLSGTQIGHLQAPRRTDID